jgi:hypothetical protein
MVKYLKVPQVNHIWRFYTGQDQKWRWQCLTVHHEVIAESQAAYKDYEGCLADAQKKGYVLQCSPAASSAPKSRTAAFPYRGR